jgi:carotenoid cleavage dioxygenase
LEKLIMKLMHDTSQSHPYLSGNFAPVEETAPVKDLPVEGHLPVSTSTTC